MAIKKYENHLGITGWVGGGCWGIERYLYTLHRVTGLAILGFFLLHIFMSSMRIQGQQEWMEAMKMLKSPILMIGEFLVFMAFTFHALNGIRLILIELGFAVGKAEEPIFPYKSSINNQRPLMVAAMVLVGVVVVWGGYNAFFLGH